MTPLKGALPAVDGTAVALVTDPTIPEPRPDAVTGPTLPPDLGRDGSAGLAFQPAVDLATGRLLGFEALLRWTDASGPVPPDVLIPWAEAHGHTSDLHAWVVSEACIQAARWSTALQVSVNCSVLQLRRGHASAAAMLALRRSGLKPQRLTVEVTEAALADADAAADLRAMASMGIHLAVDDIGSDLSVLDRIQELGVAEMKIDGSVIADVADSSGPHRAIVETLVRLSRSLGISTVAEAVETVEQVEVLRSVGTDVAQGYFFSPPLAPARAQGLADTDPVPSFDLTTSLADLFRARRSHPLALAAERPSADRRPRAGTPARVGG